MTIYVDLTSEFNKGRLRAVICSGQAVVLHRLAVMSKDGDWILREDEESLDHVLDVLSRHDARYRYGAPLDVRWMTGGWSSHFEFKNSGLRIRTDFFTRPPRIQKDELKQMWAEQEGKDPPFVDVPMLAQMKKTNRERDYSVIGELARIMSNPGDQILHSRSARDLIALKEAHPDLVAELAPTRPVLEFIAEGRERLEVELDAERRTMIHANEARLQRYLNTSSQWASAWPALSREVEALPLAQAHSVLVSRAANLLPARPEQEGP